MGKQKHDIGHQKRLKRGTQASTAKIGSTEAMAHSLVRRGLASGQILTGRPHRGGRR